MLLTRIRLRCTNVTTIVVIPAIVIIIIFVIIVVVIIVMVIVIIVIIINLKWQASRNELHNLLERPQLAGIPILVTYRDIYISILFWWQ